MVLTLERFRSLLRNRYLFHLHTNYTDGKVSVREYLEFAQKKNFRLLIFTEHVRKNLIYSFKKLHDEIKSLNLQFPDVTCLIGAEAKILPGGGLDFPAEITPLIDIVCFACHRFPDNVNLYFHSFKKLFNNIQWKRFIRIWVHPGRFFKNNLKFEAQTYLLGDLIKTAVDAGIFIEKNRKENLPPDIIEIPQEYYIEGYDIHTKKELNLIVSK